MGSGKEDLILKWMYIATSALSLQMVLWILVFPASWLGGRSELHDDLVDRLINIEGGITPASVMEKYAGHTAVHLTHTLPGAVWAGLIPFQLNSSFRKRKPTLHRWLGYIFVASSLLIAVGMIIIVNRRLLFTNFFPDLPPEPIPSEYGVVFLGIHFVFTIFTAVRFAIRKQFTSHQRWIIRHIASGLWVALQRLLVITVYSVIYRPPVSQMNQRKAFGDAVSVGVIISLLSGEVAVYLLSRGEAKKVQ